MDIIDESITYYIYVAALFNQIPGMFYVCSHTGEYHQVYEAKLQKTMEKERRVKRTMKVAVKMLKGIIRHH